MIRGFGGALGSWSAPRRRPGRARVLAASGGSEPWLRSSALRRCGFRPGFAVCKAMQNHDTSLSAPTSSCSLAPGFLVCYWTLVGKTRRSTVLGPLAAQIGDSVAVRTYRCAFARSPPPLTQPCGQGASPRLASHCLQPQPRSRRTAQPPRTRAAPPRRRRARTNHGLRRRRHQGQVPDLRRRRR